MPGPKQPRRRPRRLDIRRRRQIAVLVGGMAGGLTRAAVGARVGEHPSLPWATLFVNVTGSFLLGYLLVRFLEAAPSSPFGIPLICIGALGAYTTFGQVALELWQGGAAGGWAAVLAYGAATLVLGLMAAGLGIRMAGRHP